MTDVDALREERDKLAAEVARRGRRFGESLVSPFRPRELGRPVDVTHALHRFLRRYDFTSRNERRPCSPTPR